MKKLIILPGLNKPVLQPVPPWNWPVDSVGKNIQVMALSNALAAMLPRSLNG